VFGFLVGFYFYGLLFFANVAYILVGYLLMACCSRTAGANLITWWGAICMISVSYHHFHIADANSGGLAIDLIFMMNFVKLHMFAVNYDNAGKLDDPIKSKNFTPREIHFAEPLKDKVCFSDWIHYFFFVGASWTGMPHEYRNFDDFIHSREGYANIPKDKLWRAAFSRFGQLVIAVIATVVLGLNVNWGYLLT